MTRCISTNSEQERNIVTEERIIFDAMWIDPILAAHSEQGEQISNQRRNRTSATRRSIVYFDGESSWLIDMESVIHIKTPIFDRTITFEESLLNGQIPWVHPYARKRRKWIRRKNVNGNLPCSHEKSTGRKDCQRRDDAVELVVAARMRHEIRLIFSQLRLHTE